MGIVLDTLCILWILHFLTLPTNRKIVFFSRLSTTNQLCVISVTQNPLFSLNIKITIKEKQNYLVNYLQNYFSSYKLFNIVTSITLSKKFV